jgi:hypothetical protein
VSLPCSPYCASSVNGRITNADQQIGGNPTSWPVSEFYELVNYHSTHQKFAPNAPFTAPEFQGGGLGGWGGTLASEGCSALINEEAIRVVYKQMLADQISYFSIYMVAMHSI